MSYRGHIKNGQIVLDEPAQLPEGAAVTVEVAPKVGHITRARGKLEDFEPIHMPGPSLADELVNDRR
jgi:hypothetical protein